MRLPDEQLGLIRFDSKTRAVLWGLFLLFVLSVALKLHTSSIGVWNKLVPDGEPAPILTGAPRFIRSDEWRNFSMAIVSQVRSGFPTVNPSLGDGPVPIMASVPVRHWSMVVRPQFWGFFVLDLERAFSFYWNMKALSLCIGMFLLLMLLTDNHLKISLLGAGWVFFSGFTQWWFASALLTETGCFAILIVALHYMALSKSRKTIVIASVIFAVSSLNFGLNFYPPFTLPLFYLGVALLIGSLGPRISSFRDQLGFRVMCLGLALIGVAVFLLFYFLDTKEAFEIFANTAYPGARTNLPGGGASLVELFNGFFGVFLEEERFPSVWGNVCESSNYVLLFPVVAGAIVWRLFLRKTISGLEWTLMAYLGAAVVWVLWGFPRLLALISGFSMVPESRMLIGIGLASIILCCVFLAKSQVDIPRGIVGRVMIWLMLLAVIIVFAKRFQPYTNRFANKWEVRILCVVVATAGYSLLARRREVFASSVLLPLIWGHATVNPLTVGLGPLVNSPTLQKVSQIAAQDREAIWAVFGSYWFPDAFMASGARVFNGSKMTPRLTELRVFDPQGAQDEIYNRLAYFDLEQVTGPDSSFVLRRGDNYGLRINPSNELLRRVGIRYVALINPSSDEEFLSKTKLIIESPEDSIWVYEYLK